MIKNQDIEKMLIYIIDDKFYNVELLNQILLEEGFKQIKTYTDPEEIISAIENETPDLILMDIMMPKMDGYDLCKKILSKQEHEHIPIIMVTAASMDNFTPLKKSFENGASDFISKPVNEIELIARVKAALKSEMRRKALQKAFDEIHELQNLLPICSYCKKIRDDDDYWQNVDQYLMNHSSIKFSHGICPTCYEKHVKPQIDKLKKEREKKDK